MTNGPANFTATLRTSKGIVALQSYGIWRFRRRPNASLLYMEVNEGDNPRRSFDINLYKTGLRVADAAPELRLAAQQFDVAADALEQQLQRLGPCLLGHLSGGTDRYGAEFLSVYAETLQPGEKSAS